jgi:hypothetical protein
MIAFAYKRECLLQKDDRCAPPEKPSCWDSLFPLQIPLDLLYSDLD